MEESLENTSPQQLEGPMTATEDGVRRTSPGPMKTIERRVTRTSAGPMRTIERKVTTRRRYRHVLTVQALSYWMMSVWRHYTNAIRGWPLQRLAIEHGQQFLEGNEWLWRAAKDFLAPYLPLNVKALTDMAHTLGTRDVLPDEVWDLREAGCVHHLHAMSQNLQAICIPVGWCIWLEVKSKYALWWAFSAEAMGDPGVVTSLSTLRGIVLERIIWPGTKLAWANPVGELEYEQCVSTNLARVARSARLPPPAPIVAGRFSHQEREDFGQYDFFGEFGSGGGTSNNSNICQIHIVALSEALGATVRDTL
ncbi:hypothetical protein BDD12DRAFT_874767 [Trichophaea hybrida]|nr:hypothetical protein BDD12DRAFT_874767 [Trichophaea hybrida]